MNIFPVRYYFIIIIISFAWSAAGAVSFNIVSKNAKVTIVYSPKKARLDSITAHLLASDIERVSGYLPAVITDINKAHGNVILIGTVNSKWITSIQNQLNLAGLQNKWECYQLNILNHPFKNINQALVITGSDLRGMAYGVFDISARIGVTPWYWWADAAPVKRKVISLNITSYTSAPPSVKYRGIFINDEDWGLQPWAAKTLEPETGDIGPKTYAKVFELLLRLKANLIWPAMHPSTKAFYHYPGNIKVAADYQIVVGSSHAEPMLRNNVSEWDAKTMGAFNYVTNQQKVDAYWEARVKESSQINGIYTIGMRGVHDSGIEGVKTLKETVPLVERIFENQRSMLTKYVNPDITKVPQAFTAYKEVLDVYDASLKLPGDVTLVWPDDNYGYIQRLNDATESKRAGGSGVYYHASYWGRPHDYLWLSSTNPGLMREEMTKAYATQARNLWVLNVGDIKPAEYDIQLFMDMAYRTQPFNNSNYLKTHLNNWVAGNLGGQYANEITGVLQKYYQLAFERRPEFMGWSQTEPTTQVHFTAYNHQNYGDQAQQRIDAYTDLEKQVTLLKSKISTAKQASFYQLVYYPVVGASLINKKFLYRDKAFLYAGQGRLIAKNYEALSKAAYQQIIKETDYYNTGLSGGKWAHIMSMAPRDLPVYKAPELNYQLVKRPETWWAQPEGAIGDSTEYTPHTQLSLPIFSPYTRAKHFIDVFLCKDTSVNYHISTSASYIQVSQQDGKLTPDGMESQHRLWVSINWAKVPAGKVINDLLTINCGGKNLNVTIKADSNLPGLKNYKGYVPNNGYISIYAKSYQANQKQGTAGWANITGMGITQQLLEALPLTDKPGFKARLADSEVKKMPMVSYNFFTFTASAADINIYTLPTFPLNRSFEMRYAVSVDNGPVTVLNFKTAGRSEEWKQNVLSNSAVRKVNIKSLNAGKHQLHIYMIDPGVILDRFVIDLGGLKPNYGYLNETLNKLTAVKPF
jgi:hypothetical protein